MAVKIGVEHAKDKVGMKWCMAGMKSPAKEEGKKHPNCMYHRIKLNCLTNLSSTIY